MPVVDELSRQLWSVWRSPNPRVVSEFYSSVPVPGSLALRSRYETLADLASSGLADGAFQVDWDTWRAQLVLLDRGDRALHSNDADGAEAAFTALAATHTEGLHPLPLIDAQIGLAESARQHQQIDQAVDCYEAALGLARRYQCRFAQARAELALGYVQLDVTTVQAARDSFSRATSIAEQRGWRLTLANGLVGLGECCNRHLDVVGAHRHLLKALRVFGDLRSRDGVANATIQLGETCRRARWNEDARGWYLQAIEGIDADTAPIALANALDGLAEVEIELGLFAHARRHAGMSARVALAKGYHRGVAHAEAGLARAIEASGDPADALSVFNTARHHYHQLGVPLAEAAAWRGVARCAGKLGDLPGETKARLEAVACIESSRAAQIVHSDQAEFLSRFGHFYSEALVAAIRAGDNPAFLAVFEALAGRRLAGLLGRGSDEAKAASAQLVAQLARLTHESLWQSEAADTDTARARALRIGRIALRGSLPAMASETFEEASGAAYQPFSLDEVDALWDAMADHNNVVLLATTPHRDRLIWWARIGVGTAPQAGVSELPEETTQLINTLQSGLPLSHRLADIAPLYALMPDALRCLLPQRENLLLIPLGALWPLPWPAVPLADDLSKVLGEHLPLILAPSLTLATRRRSAPTPVGSIGWWRSDQVKAHTITAFNNQSEAIRIDSPQAARKAVLRSVFDLAVLLTHGRPAPGLVHYLDLDEGIALTPADLLQASAPPRLALIACWGAASPTSNGSDPITIATLALVRGSQEVLATTSELLDDPPSSRFVNGVLYQALSRPFAEAVHVATLQFLSRSEYREGNLSRWAPLLALGGKG